MFVANSELNHWNHFKVFEPKCFIEGSSKVFEQTPICVIEVSIELSPDYITKDCFECVKLTPNWIIEITSKVFEQTTKYAFLKVAPNFSR